jgi:hypothetical protein
MATVEWEAKFFGPRYYLEVENMEGKASTRAKNKYKAKAYDRIELVVPKGRKAAVEAHAKEKGESVNGLVNGLLRADMGLTEAEWNERPE